MRAAAVALAAVVLAAALLAAAAEGPTPQRPLRNDDVVRLLVSGVPPAEVIARIRSADAACELSADMTQELRLAGVPAEVLSAMVARQAEVDKTRAAATPAGAAAPPPSAEGKSPIVVSVRSGAAGEAGKQIVFPTRLDDAAAKVLQAGRTEDERKVSDVAVFLACRTQDHVPDQWRTKSPLGSDFVSVPRHEMLDFRPGALLVPASKAPAGFKPPAPPGGRPPGAEPELLVFPLPVELRADVEPGIVHDLVVGVAIRVGEHFLEIAEARKDGVTVGPGGLSLAAVLTESRDRGGIKLEVKIEPAGTPAPPPS